jgi:hypothetical protein
VPLLRTDASNENSASIIEVTRNGEVGTTLAVASHRSTLLKRSQLLLIANFVSSSPILITLMMEALRSSETFVFTKATRRDISEDGILHNHRRENLKSYRALTGWTL